MSLSQYRRRQEYLCSSGALSLRKLDEDYSLLFAFIYDFDGPGDYPPPILTRLAPYQSETRHLGHVHRIFDVFVETRWYDT